MKRITALTALLCAAATFAAEPDYYLTETPDSVLFIGNSYTHASGGQQTHAPGVAAGSVTPSSIYAELHSHGGYTLKQHWIDNEAQPKIRARKWDAVVLQEYDRIYPGTAALDTFLYYAAKFDALIDSVGAQTVFFCTWPNSLFDFDKLKAGYDSAGVLLDAVVVPTGLAWRIVNADRPTINLYASDGNHPGEAGVYLNGCMFAAAFTQNTPFGSTYNPAVLNLDNATRTFLQGAAWDVMRDFIEPACTDGSAPAAPGNVTAAVSTTEEVGLTWDAAAHAACGINRYYVYRDADLLGVAYGTAFSDYDFLGGYEYDYTVTAEGLNGLVSAASTALTLTTADDTDPPLLLEARPTRKAGVVTLVFNEPLDRTSAETPGNYVVDHGITVQGAVLNADGDEVTLSVSTLTADTVYTVTVTGVTDASRLQNVIAAGTQATFSYVPLALMQNCIGYWPCDNTLEDFSPVGNNGDWKQGESFGTGYKHGCLALSGDSLSPYVSVPFDSAYGGMDALTISMWIRKTHADTGGYLLNKYGIYTLFIDNDRIRGEISTDSGTRVFIQVDTDLVNDTEWHHLALCYDGSRTRVYVDAQVVFDAAQTGTVGDNTRGLLIGKFPYMHQLSFKGDLDEIRIYDAGFDSMQVALLYHEEPTALGEADSAAVRWLMDRNMIDLTVASVTVRDPSSFRVLALHLDTLGMDRITEHVGDLTAMRTFTCAGGPPADTSLVLIDPAIGGCTALETLVINDNLLSTLPDEITNLTNLTLLDVSGNMLCNVSDPVKTWLDTYDPDWADTQTGCSAITLRVPGAGIVLPVADGTLLDAMGRTVNPELVSPGIYLRYDAANGVMKKVLILK